LEGVMMSFFRNLRTGQTPNHPHLVLYTRRNCHLCEDALRHLQKEQLHYSFQLEIVDIDSNQQLSPKFGELVPVIAVDDQVRLWGNIKPVLVTRLLRGECQKQKSKRN
jgi:glutaredoxin